MWLKKLKKEPGKFVFSNWLWGIIGMLLTQTTKVTSTTWKDLVFTVVSFTATRTGFVIQHLNFFVFFFHPLSEETSLLSRRFRIPKLAFQLRNICCYLHNSICLLVYVLIYLQFSYDQVPQTYFGNTFIF